MDFSSYDKSWEAFENIFNEKLGIKESWNKIIDFHEALKPATYWSLLKALDVESEQLDIKDWMEQIAENSPVPKSAIALWIGITKLWDEETQTEYYAVYLNGSKKYDAEDIDWAATPSYEPEENYGIVNVLTKVSELISGDKDNNALLDWILPLSYCVFTIDEIIRENQLNSQLFLRGRKQLFVTVGYEEGDSVNISPIV